MATPKILETITQLCPRPALLSSEYPFCHSLCGHRDDRGQYEYRQGLCKCQRKPGSEQQNKSSGEMSECLECACAGPDKAMMHVTLAAPPLRLGGEQALSISKGSKN